MNQFHDMILSISISTFYLLRDWGLIEIGVLKGSGSFLDVPRSFQCVFSLSSICGSLNN